MTLETTGRAQRVLAWIIAAGACLALAGCGGGGGSAPTPAPTPPPPAQTAPVISTQPLATNAGIGSNVTFTVVATGTAPLLYQWLRNGSLIAGATGSTYALTVAALDNGVSYSVTVTNAAGSVTSALAMLTVVSSGTAPAFSGSLLFEQDAPLTVATGSDSASNSRTATVGQLRSVASVSGASLTTTAVQSAGDWFPQASIKQADIDSAGGVLRNLRERFRVYLQGGRLVRVDLSTTTTPARISTLAQSELCFGDDFAQVFDDWSDPTNSILVYRVRPLCNNSRIFDDFPDRRYVAVRVGMGSGDAPIDLGSLQPVIALRDRAGATTGYVAFDGTQLVRTNATFGARSTLATSAEPQDDRLLALGVFGSDAAPYLLYAYVPLGAPVEYRTVPLSGGAYRTVGTAVSAIAAVAADSDAVYLSYAPTLTDGETLVRSGHDGSVTTLASRLPGGLASGARLRLTPTRVIHEVGGTLTSVLKAGGSRETYTAPASGLGIRAIAVVGSAE